MVSVHLALHIWKHYRHHYYFSSNDNVKQQKYWTLRKLTTWCEASITYIYTGHFPVMVTHFLQSTTVRGTNLHCTLWNVSDTMDIPCVGPFILVWTGRPPLSALVWQMGPGARWRQLSIRRAQHSVQCVLAHSLYKNGMVWEKIASHVWMKHAQWPCLCSSTFGLRLWWPGEDAMAKHLSMYSRWQPCCWKADLKNRVFKSPGSLQQQHLEVPSHTRRSTGSASACGKQPSLLSRLRRSCHCNGCRGGAGRSLRTRNSPEKPGPPPSSLHTWSSSCRGSWGPPVWRRRLPVQPTLALRGPLCCPSSCPGPSNRPWSCVTVPPAWGPTLNAAGARLFWRLLDVIREERTTGSPLALRWPSLTPENSTQRRNSEKRSDCCG